MPAQKPLLQSEKVKYFKCLKKLMLLVLVFNFLLGTALAFDWDMPVQWGKNLGEWLTLEPNQNPSQAFVCDSISSKTGKLLNYCYLSPEKFNASQSPLSLRKYSDFHVSLMLFFHGAGLNDLSKLFGGFYRATDGYLEKHKSAPIPLFFSFGPAWVLSTHAKYYSHQELMQSLLPQIQARIQAQEPQLIFENNYRAMGVSMGGHNVLQMAFNYPERFQKVVVACPAVIKLAPNSTPAEINNYILRTHANPQIAAEIPKIIKSSFQDNAHFWRDNLLTLAAKYVQNWRNYDEAIFKKPFEKNSISVKKPPQPKVLPKIRVSFEAQDEFGFGSTAGELLGMILPTITDIEILKVSGTHCTAKAGSFIQMYNSVME